MTDSVKEYLGIVIDYSRDKNLPEEGKRLLTGKGFYKKEHENSPQETFARAATSYCFGDYDLAQRIYDYVSQQWFTYASPVLSNAEEVNWPSFGEDEFKEAGDWLEENVETDSLPISCFLISNAEDTKQGLVESSNEARWLSMMGGGIGIYAGNRSPDEKSTGVMAHLRGYDADALAYRQTSTRRGSIGVYLDIDHPEIIPFLDMRNPVGGDSNKKCFNLNNAVNIPDWFMRAVIADEEYELKDPKHGATGNKLKAREVWEKILQTRFETGEPYIHFIDTTNRNLPKWITKPTYRVTQSNLCVAPETQILTKNGYVPIAELEDLNVEVWNGEEWSSVDIIKTGEGQKLITVETSSGYELDCTPYHKFYIFDGYGRPYVEVRASELREGDKLAKFDLPVVDGELTLERAYENGFYTGDGCCYKGKQIVYLYHDKMQLKNNFTNVNWNYQEDQKRMVGITKGLRDKFFVPSDNYTIESRLEWLAGFLDADGCVYTNGDNQALTACSTEKNFLREVQLMLQTLGVSSKVVKLFDEGYRELPVNNGTGDLSDYWCKESYRLLITSCDSYKLLCLGLNLKRLSIEKRKPQRDAKQFVKVTGVVDKGRVDDTYCFNEPKRHMGMFNGLLTGQCSEILLMTSSKRTAVCCLSSLNLDKFDEWKDTTIVEDLTTFLDNVLEYFIRLAPNHLYKAVYSASKERAIGVGTLGYASYIQSKRIPFESGGFNSAASITHMLYSTIKERAVESSKRLAVLRGEAPDCEGSGMRNSHLLALAPNASSSNMVGVSPSTEPMAYNAFLSEGRAGSFLVKNPRLKEFLKEKGMDTDEVWEFIASDKGSVINLEGLTDEEKSWFKTFKEINPKWVIELAAIRQGYICQGQSLNISVGKDISKQEMSDIHMLAWIKGIKTLYYCRGQKHSNIKTKTSDIQQPLNKVDVDISFTECLSCEG